MVTFLSVVDCVSSVADKQRTTKDRHFTLDGRQKQKAEKIIIDPAAISQWPEAELYKGIFLNNR
jgi:hypothetical protein